MVKVSRCIGIAAALYAQGAAALMNAPQLPRLPVPLLAEQQADADAGSRDRVVSGLERRYNARAVRISEVMVDGRLAYDVRLLSNNRVWTVRVDAATGQELPRDN